MAGRGGDGDGWVCNPGVAGGVLADDVGVTLLESGVGKVARRGRHRSTVVVLVWLVVLLAAVGCRPASDIEQPASPVPVTTAVYGSSRAGRPLTLTVVGDPAATRRVLVIGCLHGSERGGVPIAADLARRRPPDDVAYLVVVHPNPDGEAARTRGNAAGVDLNRNFPSWTPSRPSTPFYSGSGPLSEPESAALTRVILDRRPTVVISYHQALNLVDASGTGGEVLATRYASTAGLAVRATPAHPGSLPTWLAAVLPGVVVLTVELPWTVTPVLADAQLRAIEAVAASL
ncbi:MAG: DUF2817 domain-containing protein [Kineosporiaceae bacterium]|nr:DUF2817 domain-containing protein [Kineosporiaceae bacterium]